MMTRKRFLNELMTFFNDIMTQAKTEIEIQNSDLKKQIQEQSNETNKVLLDSFSEKYEKALSDFSDTTAVKQNEFQYQVTSMLEKFIEKTVEHEDNLQKGFISTINSLKDEQQTTIKSMSDSVNQIKDLFDSQNEKQESFLLELKSKIDVALSGVNSTMCELKELISKSEENNARMYSDILDAFKNQSTMLSEKFEEQKKINEESAGFNSGILVKIKDNSEEKINQIKEIVEEFTENQDSANSELQDKMKKTIEHGIEDMCESLQDNFKNHQDEMLMINQKISEVTGKYEIQLKTIEKFIQKNQELSSNDVQLLEKLLK